jgi:hypothetical protein
MYRWCQRFRPLKCVNGNLGASHYQQFAGSDGSPNKVSGQKRWRLLYIKINIKLVTLLGFSTVQEQVIKLVTKKEKLLFSRVTELVQDRKKWCQLGNALISLLIP